MEQEEEENICDDVIYADLGVDPGGYLRGMHTEWGFLSGGYNLGCNLRGVNLQGGYLWHSVGRMVDH